MEVPTGTPRRARGLRAPALLGILATAAAAASGGASHGTPAHEGSTSPSRSPDSFAAEMHAAMMKMDAGMAVAPTGDPDRDFARMMIPHHQGAIDMAIAELRYGKDERLRRLAQEIIVDQQQEIAVMHLALGEAAPPGKPSPTQVQPVHPGTEEQ
jgi:uncharacterized protein (DUF305 family)